MKRMAFPFVLLLAGLGLFSLLDLILGAVPIGAGEIVGWATGHGFADPLHRQIWLELRLPRLFLALIAGGSLAVSGTICQAALRNPLADPYILGLASGAAAGAVGGSFLCDSPYFLYPCAFAGALLALGCALGLAHIRRGSGPTALLLAGVIVSFFFSALLLLLLYFFRQENLASTYLWLIGSLGRAERRLCGPLLALTLPPLLWLWARARRLDPLALDEESARQAGFVPQRERMAQLLLASWLAAAAVSFAGVIGFLGLIVPHALRPTFGCTHRRLLPAAFLGGALLLVAADATARWLLPQRELPVGILTSLCGAPFFLLWFARQGREDSDA